MARLWSSRLGAVTVKVAGEPTPFEAKWGLQRGGWGRDKFPLLCRTCGGTLGLISSSDWLYTHRKGWRTSDGSNIAHPCGRVHDLVIEHIESPATPKACLALYMAAGTAMYHWIAKSPNADPGWLIYIAKHDRHDYALLQNPLLPLLLLEDPSHLDWIEKLRGSPWRKPYVP